MARNFAEILKGQPGTTAVHFDTALQRRRARTYSQVIADATRGVDAGMAMPSGGRMSEPGPTADERQRPDWRGHYLGKRDFNAVLKDVRAAIDAPLGTVGDVLKFQGAGSLYVRRDLKNADDLHTWAKGAGIPNLVPPAEMHATQVYSRTPVQLNVRGDTITADGGKRSIAPLGDKGGVVLHFASKAMEDRHAEVMAAGGSHDFPKFLTHVTLSYDAGGMDVTKLTPPSFPLVFGPEIHEPINDNWAEEKGLRKFDITVPITKTDADQFLVFGWAQVIEKDGVSIIDTQGDEVTESDLEDAFYYFAQEGRETDEMHTDDCRGRMVECMVFTKAKQKALGIDLGKVGAWVGFKVDPDVFAKVKDGTYPSFSIGGTGRRVPVGEAS